MRWLLLFVPFLSWGQCDLEIVGFNPISTDMTLAVNGGACMTDADSIGEFLLGLTFTQPIPNISDDYPCFYPDGWAKLIFPLDFPGFDIGEGDDNILQTGDTITFNLLETPWAGSGTADCWIQIFQDAAYFEECVIVAVYQVNDSPDLGDDDLWNSWVEWSLNGACDPPPPPLVQGCTDMFAFNYNSEATDDDGTCVYEGCLDPDALNYCEECSIEGECNYAPDEGEECFDPQIYCPNTFTPNGDMVNEYWKPVTREECWWRWECSIYNRWGTLVWRSYDPSDKWIGNRLGYFVPDGVYVWHIKATTFRSTKAVDIYGHITIFR
jgi:gliding motility-associated-like protein